MSEQQTGPTLVKKLSKVMDEVKYIQKKGYNQFHKYSYATESDVSEKVREVLSAHNVMMIPSIVDLKTREHQNRRGAVEYIATVTMEFTFMDGDSGEEIKFISIGEGQDAGDKAVYKAITGAQKYALMKTFLIPTGDDPEADSGVDERNSQQASQKAPQRPKTPPKQPSNGITHEQMKTLGEAVKKVSELSGIEAPRVYENAAESAGVKGKQSKALTKDEADKIIQFLGEFSG